MATLERLLAVLGTVDIHRRIQFCQIGRGRLRDLHDVELVLVGVGLEVGAITVEHAAIDHATPDGLAHDLVEDLLIDGGIKEAAASVLGFPGLRAEACRAPGQMEVQLACAAEQARQEPGSRDSPQTAKLLYRANGLQLVH